MDPVSPVSTQHSTISYQVFDNMNRRTAEQGTAEYRSEKHCLIAFKNFCCSKFLVRHSIFKIQERLNSALSWIENSAQYNFRQSHSTLTPASGILDWPFEDPATRGRTRLSMLNKLTSFKPAKNTPLSLASPDIL